MQIKNRQQALALVAIAGIALLAADRLVYQPLSASWKARSRRIAELKNSLSQGEKLLQRDRVIRERWESMRTNTLPDNVSTAEGEVFRAFDRWSQDSRISVSSMKPQWKSTEEGYMTLECHADASGNLPALARFLYEIEKDPLALKIDSLEITARDNNGQQLSLSLQVSGLMLTPPAP